jgi:hypothetical protein
MFSTLLGVATIVTMASLWLVGAASAAPASVQIKIRNQDCCDTGEVVVNSVVAAQDGWLGIYKDATATPGSLIGYAPVHQGQNTSFTVDIESNRVESSATLYAELLVDESGTGMFDINTVAPAPNTPIVAFATETAVQPAAPMAPASSAAPVVQTKFANQIKIMGQDCCDTGEVVVSSITAAQDGWLGIYKDATAAPGSLVGYAPVHRGQNTSFTVDIESYRIGSAPALWAQLLVDESGTGMFDINTVAPAPNTPVVGFATQAGQ